MGIPGILLLPKIDQKLKDNSESALNEDGLIKSNSSNKKISPI